MIALVLTYMDVENEPSFYVVQIPISPLKTYKHTRRMSESWYVIDTLNNVFHLCVNSFLIIIPPSSSLFLRCVTS